jgi:hypothetical protein
MNDQLEAFRKRLRGPEKPSQPRDRMKVKQWVAIVISIVALGISAVTAYYSVILQSEEKRVFVDQIPLLIRTADTRLQVEGILDIAFVNTGTRPIVVRSVDLIIEDASKKRTQQSLRFNTWIGILFCYGFIRCQRERVGLQNS